MHANLWGQTLFNPLFQCVYIYVCIVKPDIQTIDRCSHTSIHTNRHTYIDTYKHTYIVCLYVRTSMRSCVYGSMYVYINYYIVGVLAKLRKSKLRHNEMRYKVLSWLTEPPLELLGHFEKTKCSFYLATKIQDFNTTFIEKHNVLLTPKMTFPPQKLTYKVLSDHQTTYTSESYFLFLNMIKPENYNYDLQLMAQKVQTFFFFFFFFFFALHF